MGIDESSSIYNFKIEDFSSSLMNDYPLNYKFSSISISASPVGKSTQRSTYDILAAFSDIGGLNEFIRTFLGLVISGFSMIQSQALITNHLFKYNTEKKEDSEIKPPRYLEVKYAFNALFCCCQLKETKDYMKDLAVSERYLNDRLDLV